MLVNTIESFVKKNQGNLVLNDDGTLTKAAFGQGFRGAFNIGGARDQNQAVLNALKEAIRNDPDFFTVRDEAMAAVEALRGKWAISGKEIGALVARFRGQVTGRTIENLTTEHIALRTQGIPEAFENRGLDADFIGIAQRYVEEKYQGTAQKERFNVMEALESFYAEVNEQLAMCKGPGIDVTDAFCRHFKDIAIGGNASVRSTGSLAKYIAGYRKTLAMGERLTNETQNANYARLAGIYVNYIKEPLDTDGVEALFKEAERTSKMIAEKFDAALEGGNIESLSRALHLLIDEAENMQATKDYADCFKASADDYMGAMRHFVRFIVAELPTATREKLHALMFSEEAKELRRYFTNEAFNDGPNRKEIANAEKIFDAVYRELSGTQTDQAAPDFDVFRTDVNPKSLPSAILNQYSGKFVLTNAPNVKVAPKRLLTDRVGNPSLFPRRVEKIATGLLKTQLVQEMREGTIEASFRRDVPTLDVTLPNGTKLSHDPAAACDMLARVVTGQDTATFAGLDAAGKKRVQVVMALLLKNCEALAEEAVGRGLDPTRNVSQLVPEQGTNATHAIKLEVNAEKGVSVHLRGRRDIRSYTVREHLSWNQTQEGFEQESFDVDEGSFTDSSLDVTISADELKRLETADWANATIDLKATPTFRLHITGQAFEESAIYD